MEVIDKHNIPLKYRVPLQGKMNKGVFQCLNSGSYPYECSGDVSHRTCHYWVIEDIIGFAESQWGWMVVWICKECGQVQFFHLRPELEGLDYVKAYDHYVRTGEVKYFE